MNNGGSCELHLAMVEGVKILGEESLYDDRIRGAVSDISPKTYKLFNPVLTRATAFGIAQKLSTYRSLDDDEFEIKLTNLRQDFQESNFLKPGISKYIIDCYLLALDMVADIDDYDPESDVGGGGKCGELSFIEHNGIEYCGSFNTDSQRSGFGVAKETQGGYYAGEWKLDMRNGHGLHTDDRRNKYAGEWRMNRRNGVGVSCSCEGYRYAGEWKNGKRHGHGIVFLPNGEKMFVQFKDDQIVKSAEGVFYLKDGTFITGKMTENGPDGACTHTLLDGTTCKENWKNGKLI